MWAYIYYSIYLDQVDISDHNAIEKYVYTKVINYTVVERSLEESLRVSIEKASDAVWTHDLMLFQMQAGDADYIPYNKALVLKEEKDEDEELKKEVKELKKSLQDIYNELKVIL